MAVDGAQGSHVTMTCLVGGPSPTTLTWFNGTEELSSDSRISLFTCKHGSVSLCLVAMCVGVRASSACNTVVCAHPVYCADVACHVHVTALAVLTKDANKMLN